jgi:hypothetical protein
MTDKRKTGKCCQEETYIAQRLEEKGHSSPVDAVDRVVDQLEKSKVIKQMETTSAFFRFFKPRFKNAADIDMNAILRNVPREQQQVIRSLFDKFKREMQWVENLDELESQVDTWYERKLKSLVPNLPRDSEDGIPNTRGIISENWDRWANSEDDYA